MDKQKTVGSGSLAQEPKAVEIVINDHIHAVKLISVTPHMRYGALVEFSDGRREMHNDKNIISAAGAA